MGPSVGEGEGAGAGEGVGPGVGEREGEGVGVDPGDGEGEGAGVGDGKAVGVGAGEGAGEGEGEDVGEGEGVGPLDVGVGVGAVVSVSAAATVSSSSSLQKMLFIKSHYPFSWVMRREEIKTLQSHRNGGCCSRAHDALTAKTGGQIFSMVWIVLFLRKATRLKTACRAVTHATPKRTTLNCDSG